MHRNLLFEYILLILKPGGKIFFRCDLFTAYRGIRQTKNRFGVAFLFAQIDICYDCFFFCNNLLVIWGLQGQYLTFWIWVKVESVWNRKLNSSHWNIFKSCYLLSICQSVSTFFTKMYAFDNQFDLKLCSVSTCSSI